MHISPSMIKLASASCALICSLGMGTVALAATNDIARPEHSQEVTHLYNPYTHEHFYSSDAAEVKNLVSLGWQNHGRAWYAPEKDAAGAARVYRLFNPYNDDHHYTSSMEEVKACVEAGWQFEENVEIWGFASSDAPSGEASQAPRTGVQRLFNPYAERSTHYFTANQEDAAKNVALGWKYESTSWYVYAAGQPEKEKAQDDAGGAVLGMLGGGGAAAGAGAEDAGAGAGNSGTAGAGNSGEAGGTADNKNPQAPGVAPGNTDNGAQNGDAHAQNPQSNAQTPTPSPKTLTDLVKDQSGTLSPALQSKLTSYNEKKKALSGKAPGSSEEKAAQAEFKAVQADLRAQQLGKFIGAASYLGLSGDKSINDNLKQYAAALKSLRQAEFESLVAPKPDKLEEQKKSLVSMVNLYKNKVPVNAGYKDFNATQLRGALTQINDLDSATKAKLQEHANLYSSLVDTLDSLSKQLEAASDKDSLEYRAATNIAANLNKTVKDPLAYYQELAHKAFSKDVSEQDVNLKTIQKQYTGRLVLASALNEWLKADPNEELLQKATQKLATLSFM